MCRVRRELSNEYLLAKFGFDTAENESLKVCLISFNFQVMGFNFHILNRYSAPVAASCIRRIAPRGIPAPGTAKITTSDNNSASVRSLMDGGKSVGETWVLVVQELVERRRVRENVAV